MNLLSIARDGKTLKLHMLLYSLKQLTFTSLTFLFITGKFIGGMDIATGSFEFASESVGGFEYLQSKFENVDSRIFCASLCVKNLQCDGFVFYQEGRTCKLVDNVCNGSVHRPDVGELYLSAEPCPSSKGYQMLDLGATCPFCVRVVGESSLTQTYVNAREVCKEDGGYLFHYEGVNSLNFSMLQQYSLSSGSQVTPRYWVGINSLLDPSSSSSGLNFYWDHSQTELTKGEYSAIPWAPGEPSANRAQPCVYISRDFTTFGDSPCSDSVLGFICIL